MNGRVSRVRLLAIAVVAVLIGVVLVAWRTTDHAGTLTASSTVTGRGTSVTAEVSLSAGGRLTADYAGVCFEDARGQEVDFPLERDVSLTPDPAVVRTSGSLAPGRYSFSTCVRVDHVWTRVGPPGVLTVSDQAGDVPATVTTPESTVSTPSNGASAGDGAEPPSTVAAVPPTGTPLPVTGVAGAADSALPLGDLPGWRQVLAEDFTRPVARGAFPGRPYRDRWFTYDGFDNPAGTLLYDTRNVTSVHDGVLDVGLGTQDGRARGAGVVALVNGDGSWGGRTYGRYSLRFRADPAPGWGMALLLWSDRNDWGDGEIDMAEGLTTDTISAYNHDLDRPSENAMSVTTDARWADWHVATVDWTPDGVVFQLDGVEIGRSATSPHQPLHLVLQTVTGRAAPPADATGRFLVDWVAAYERE